jgi:hypothetical protein
VASKFHITTEQVDEVIRWIELDAEVIRWIELDAEPELAPELELEPEPEPEPEKPDNSLSIRFSAQGWTLPQREKVEDAASWFHEQFEGCSVGATTIHPLFRLVTIDLNRFDIDGDKKQFDGWTLDYGPYANERPYHQPPSEQGWQGWGLKVKGMFPPDPADPNDDGDGWLGDENSPKSWWRAYHGTSCEAMRCIAGAAGKDGALRTGEGKMGEGVYVTPHIEYAAMNYARVAKIGRFDEPRRLSIVFMCAVKPAEMLDEDYPMSDEFFAEGQRRLKEDILARYGAENSEWLFEAHHVRPYRILLADANVLEAQFGLPSGTLDGGGRAGGAGATDFTSG